MTKAEKKMNTVSVESELFERIGNVALKASQVTGLRITKGRIVKAMIDNYSLDIIKKYESAVQALRREKLL